ncbi:hypothetical protein [Sinomonas sp. G460-2]|uniref:hypothetical protein n=1 Tax=Sinomonas sp. G460-2 TaxID=3393464 RepID=UPI0039EEAAD0
MRFVKAFLRFWYDFIIGDDWKIAASVVAVLAVGAGLVLAGLGGSPLFAPLLAVGLAAAFTAALAIDVRRHPRG